MIDIPRTDETFGMASVKHDGKLIGDSLERIESIAIALDLAVAEFDHPDAYLIGQATDLLLDQLRDARLTATQIAHWL